MIPFYEEKNSGLQTFEGVSMNFPQHLHTALEIMYLKSGTISATCDGKEYTLNKGDLFVCFPNVIHSYFAPENTVHFHIAICPPLLLGEYLNTLMNFIPIYPVIKSDLLHKDVDYAINGLFEENSNNNRSEAVCRALTQLILSRIMPLLELEENTAPRSTDTVTRAIEYISKNFTNPLTLEKTAKHIGVSKCHLSHVFSSRMHTGFNSYINSLRLSLAQSLLTNTDKDILSVSSECGFESQRTFNRAFMKMYSITPSQYRAEYKK